MRTIKVELLNLRTKIHHLKDENELNKRLKVFRFYTYFNF